MDVPAVLLGVIAGLALFLYGVANLATGMRAIAGTRMQSILARLTINRFAGLASGAAVTAILDSSSVTIIMVIALVDAGLLSFVQSLGVILGANVGTTVSSQLIAFDVERYSPAVLALGLALHFGGRTAKWKNAGLAVLGLGLVFFGLGQMGAAVEPLKESDRFTRWMTGLERPIVGVAVGALVTLIIQSSSATVGIAITLATQDLLSVPAGVAVMLGAEIGTCADTLLATLGRSREALRAGIFHLAFNATTAIVGVLLIDTLIAGARMAGGGDERQIANAHVLFNVAGATTFVLILAPIARTLERIIPARSAPTTAEPKDAASGS